MSGLAQKIRLHNFKSDLFYLNRFFNLKQKQIVKHFLIQETNEDMLIFTLYTHPG